MTIPVGRRRLVISLVIAPSRKKVFDVPAALDASDGELARLGSLTMLESSRVQREAAVLMYGGFRAV